MGRFSVPEDEMERCIRLLQDIEKGMNAEQVLLSIRPTVVQLRNGEKIFEMIQKLVRANNSDRAVKLLQIAPRGRGGVFRKVGLVFSIAMSIFIFIGAGPLMSRCNGAYEPAMAALNACPQAAQLLGSPITQSSVGMACGSSESSGSYGQASWRISVHGDKGSGQFEFAGRDQGNGWRLDNAVLTVGNQTLSVHPCGAVSAPAESLTAAVNFSGTVTSVMGNSAVQQNSACSISVSPTPSEARDAGYNCHVKVQCGNAVLYGWEGSGYTRCQAANGAAVRADDTTGASAGDDPKLTLDIAARSCIVSDDGNPPFTVSIALSGM